MAPDSSVATEDMTGAERFQRLSAEDRALYTGRCQRMVEFARAHAVPIIFAPPLSQRGEVNGATGCLVRLAQGTFVVTASHVLNGYEHRRKDGEALHWQVGKLPPFDPVTRIAWHDEQRDVVFLRISAEEAQGIGPCITSTPSRWPPPAPDPGQLVLVAGYPGLLRDVDAAGGRIGAGPYSTMLRVTSSGDGYCTCQIAQEDLVSFDGSPLPDPGTNMGGVSGGPVLLMAPNYPLVGIVTAQVYLEGAACEFLRIATFEGVCLEDEDCPSRGDAALRSSATRIGGHSSTKGRAQGPDGAPGANGRARERAPRPRHDRRRERAGA